MAGSSGSFRQLEDKPCSAEVHCMKWSPKMDLLALVSAEGEVWLHRLSWKRVWCVPASEGKAVQIAWRPDGKLLCVGHQDGTIKLFDVENAECIHTCSIGETPSCMDWIEQEKTTGLCKDIDKQPFNVDKAELLLPALPSLPKSGESLFSKDSNEEGNKDPKKLSSLPEELSILCIGDNKGQVHIFLYGVFLCGVVSMTSTVEDSEILNASFSTNLQVISAVIKSKASSEQQAVLLELYGSPLLSSRRHELSVISKKIGTILTLMEYFNKTIILMSEAWEDILLEMDTKLTTFASERLAAGSSVSEEFLTLLTRGTASPELQAFLLHELTEKGLKKLGHNIENSYSSIQGLALKHLQCVTQALLFHLTEMNGMSKWYDHFGILGLSDESIQKAIKMLGSVMLKTRELVDVIETSLKSFKAFFQWLYSVILRLSDEAVPSYVKQFSQQDIIMIANFLQDQLKVNDQGKFSLERVGQYFEDKPLTDISAYGDTPWTRFVANNPVLIKSPLIMTHNKNVSLTTLAKQLQESIENAFKKLADTIGNSFQCQSSTHLADCDSNSLVTVSQSTSKSPGIQNLVFGIGENELMKVFLVCLASDQQNEGLVAGKASTVFVSQIPTEEDTYYRIRDVMFYDSETLTVLLREKRNDETEGEKATVLAQISLNLIPADNFITLSGKEFQYGSCLAKSPNLTVHDIGSKLTHYRKLSGFQSGSISVSGSRKVSCVLSSSRRRVKLFDMDAEDEEEDDEDEVSKNESKDFEETANTSF